MAHSGPEFASVRHAGQYREIDRAPFIAHPIEVGEPLRGAGQPDEVIAAGLLHDVLATTATTSAELDRRFGSRIAWLVETVSDDPLIGDYEERKRGLRGRARSLRHHRDLRRGQDRQRPRAGAVDAAGD